MTRRSSNLLICLLMLWTLCDAVISQADTAKDVQTLAAQDLASIANLNFTSNSDAYRAFFGGDNGISLKAYFTSRIQKVSFYRANSSIEMGRAANSEIELSQNYLASTDDLERWVTLIHEARHAGGANQAFNHVSCPKPFSFNFENIGYKMPYFNFLSGLPGCDSNVSGAYAVQYVFLRAIYETCSNCSTSMRQSALQKSYEAVIRIQDQVGLRDLINQTSIIPDKVISIEMPKFLKRMEQIPLGQ